MILTRYLTKTNLTCFFCRFFSACFASSCLCCSLSFSSSFWASFLSLSLTMFSCLAFISSRVTRPIVELYKSMHLCTNKIKQVIWKTAPTIMNMDLNVWAYLRIKLQILRLKNGLLEELVWERVHMCTWTGSPFSPYITLTLALNFCPLKLVLALQREVRFDSIGAQWWWNWLRGGGIDSSFKGIFSNKMDHNHIMAIIIFIC